MGMKKIKVLFVCVHNSARSQIAEAYLNSMYGDRFEAQSSRLEPGVLNSYAVGVMGEVGLDISRNKTKDVFDFVKKGEIFGYVITVCDGANAERCPIFSGITKRLHWSFPDPAILRGTDEEKLQGTREIRDAIKTQIEEWVKTID
jgi:arsenate reductase